MPMHKESSHKVIGENYAEGGDVEGDDNSALLDHVALECMHAIESKDKDSFLDAFHVLVADILQKMESKEEEA